MNNYFVDFFCRHTIKGFLDHQEGMALYQHALSVAAIGPCLEIGSYCGKSTVYLGQACQSTGNALFAVDHHRGSEEHQPGEEYHDSELFDASRNRMDSFQVFRDTLRSSQLEECVVPVVSTSALVLKHWRMPLGLVFIDGGHSPEMSLADCVGWSDRIVAGGKLCIHDIFESPSEGGQGPYLAMRAVLARGDYEFREQVGSLAVLQRRD